LFALPTLYHPATEKATSCSPDGALDGVTFQRMFAAMSTNYIPAGYRTATPYLVVKDAARAIAFYQQVFGAAEVMRLAASDGKVAHAEIRIGDSQIMLADEFPDWGALSPQTVGGSPVTIMLYVEDCDAVFNRAIAAGATVQHPYRPVLRGSAGSLVDPLRSNGALPPTRRGPPERSKRFRPCASALEPFIVASVRRR
jgi:PhnB protein